MKKYTLPLILALAFASQTAYSGSWKTYNGTSSRLEVSLGGGYSQLGYQFDKSSLPYPNLDVKATGSWSAKAHLGYRFFFTNWVGLGVGANFQRYGGAPQLDGTITYNGVTDTDGERYNHTVQLHKWQQRDEIYMVEIPVSLCFAIPVQQAMSITLELGGLYGIPVIKSYTGHGEITHTGYYEPWHLTLHDQPDHGFYTESSFAPKGSLSTQNAWAVFGKLGVAVPVAEHLELLVQAYAHYYLTSPIKVQEGGRLGFRNDREGMQQVHYFMSEYESLSTLGITKADPKPFNIGLEVGLRYSIPHKSRHCLCRIYDNGTVPWASK